VKLSVNKAHYPVTVLGYGRRIGIWTQGCSIGCKGCVSQDTWVRDANRDIPVTDLLAWCREMANRGLDGLTISGGEPFEQADALAYFLAEFRSFAECLPRPVDVLCYSGLPYERIRREHATLLTQIDALVPEPYVHKLPGKPLRGSSNQPVVPLTPLGLERYGDPDVYGGKRFQVAVDGDQIWFVGIPERGDMARLEEYCEARGLVFAGGSWRG
jgi:anaerobic ribonucleoside-triphosphate reductase activating protein